MGLFDLDMSNPEAQGFNSALMQAAAALLTPRHRGGGVGSAFAAFPQAIEQSKALAQRNRMLGLQEQQMGLQGQKLGFEMDEALRKHLLQQASQDRFNKLVGQLPEGERAIAELVGPAYFEPKTLAPGASLVSGGKTLAQVPKTPEPTELERLVEKVNSLPPGDPNRAFFQKRIDKLSTHAPAATAISYGAPVVGLGPNGEQQYFQPSNRGGLQPTGVAPLPKSTKPMPPSVLKQQSESIEAIGTLKGINADLGAVVQQIDSGSLDLGVASNFWNQARNAVGSSTEQSRNFASFRATLEKMRNATLMLHNGVQTEGDAQRAWNELIANINDPKFVKQRLQEIQAINERGALIHQTKIDTIRQEYEKDSLNLGDVTTTQPALGQGSQGAADPLGMRGRGKPAADPLGIR